MLWEWGRSGGMACRCTVCGLQKIQSQVFFLPRRWFRSWFKENDVGERNGLVRKRCIIFKKTAFMHNSFVAMGMWTSSKEILGYAHEWGVPFECRCQSSNNIRPYFWSPCFWAKKIGDLAYSVSRQRGLNNRTIDSNQQFKHQSWSRLFNDGHLDSITLVLAQTRHGYTDLIFLAPHEQKQCLSGDIFIWDPVCSLAIEASVITACIFPAK